MRVRTAANLLTGLVTAMLRYSQFPEAKRRGLGLKRPMTGFAALAGKAAEDDPYRSPQTGDANAGRTASSPRDAFVFRAVLFVSLAFINVYLLSFVCATIWNLSTSRIAPSVLHVLILFLMSVAWISVSVIMIAVVLNRHRLRLVAGAACLLTLAGLMTTIYLL